MDFASFIAGPGAAVILSDFGADVIKVEPPSGDLWRKDTRSRRSRKPMMPIPGTWLTATSAADARFEISERPARSRETRQMGRRGHCQHAACRTEAIEPGIRRLVQWNPRLIYADVTGFGEKGPDADLPGFDITSYWARSGLLSMTRDAGAAPTWPVAGSGDNATAVGLYAAIVTALYRRERTGKGSYVTTSLLAEGVWSASVSIQAALCEAKFFGLHDRKNPANAALNVYRARMTSGSF